MDTFEIFVAAYMATVPVLAGFLLAARLRRIETEISEVRSDLHTEIAALRSDLTQVALAVGARPRASEA